MTVTGSYHHPFERRRADLDRLQSNAVQFNRVSGFELTEGVGETTIDVEFPVWFVHKPAMSFGGEMEVGESIEAEHFPTVSVVVVTWTKAQEDRVGGGWFIGARLAVVTTGRDGHKMWVHWQAEGKALSTPSGSGVGGLEEAL